jgi:V8-like Glu-specific endopeptidase
MADTDVVKHDLDTVVSGEKIDWDEFTEPVPFPGEESGLSAEIGRVEVAPPVTTRVTDEELVTAPFRSVGKMGLIIGGEKKTASGWVVARRAFFTAGHCVFHPNFGGWITWASFAPRFNKRVDTIFRGATVYSLKGWVDSNNRAFDMAACVVTVNFADTEPPLAFDTGIIPGLNFTALGYPLRPIPGHDFNGKRMWKSVGKFIKLENDRIYAANSLTNGASGGPWCETHNQMIVSGLNAQRLKDAEVCVSPSFDNGFENLYNAVKDF